MGCLALIVGAILTFFIGGAYSIPSPDAPPVSSGGDYASYSDIPQSRTEDGGFVLGYQDAPLTIVVFEDFFCPHCQSLHPTMNEVVEAYVRTGVAKYEWRALATAGGERLNEVARLLECAEEQRTGAFWEGYLVTYEQTIGGAFPSDAAAFYADTLNLDEGELLSCAENAEQYLYDGMLANELGAMGTPAIYVRYSNGDVVAFEGGRSFEDFERLIEQGKDGVPTYRDEA
jgi:protein-disulfide isomerase